MIANAGKRFLSLLLAIIMVVGMVPQIPLPAKAAVNGSFTNTNLSASSSDGTWTISNGNTISATVKTTSSTSCGSTSYTKVSTTVTLTNGYAEAAKLDIDATMAGNGTISGAITAAGSTTLDVAGNSSITIKVTSADNSTEEVKLTLTLDLYVPDTEQTITNTYLPAENGSYSVDGETVDADGSTVGKIYGSTSTLKVVSSAEGYKFFSWYNATTGTYVSDQEEYTITYEKDAQIRPVFMRSDGALFGVGSATFCDLTEAVNYAQKTLATKIVLLNNGTLYGAHTIPTGITFLISFDDNTLYTTTPAKVNGNNTAWVKPTEKRMLTMADGAKLTIKGAMSLSNQIYAAHSPNIHAGSPHGECAFVTMNKGSSITVENGGALYAWGFITGPGVKNGDVNGSGTITAKDGATVYECFQVTDWRGGTVISKIKNGVFPLSQFYVQNIEVPLTLEHGAKESGYTAIHASIIGVQGTSVDFIGATGSMFAMSSGSVKKWYNGAKDRLVVEATGDLSISGVTMAVPGAGDINSSEFNLGINSNITVKIKSGSTIAINQDVALYPGAEIIVEEGAICTLGTPNASDATGTVELYVYDKDQWGGYVGSGNQQFIALEYAPGRNYTRSAKDLVDAKVQVDGTVDAQKGYLYTTTGGGNVFTNGTGRIIMKAGTATKTYQYIYEDQYPEIPVTSAKLYNWDTSADPDQVNSVTSYTTTTDAAEATTYGWHSVLKKWVKVQDVKVTYNANDGTDAPATVEQDETGEEMLDGLTLLGSDTFKREGHTLTGWNTASDGTGTSFNPGVDVPIVTNYAAQGNVEFTSDTTLYAQWQIGKYTIHVDMNDGSAVQDITKNYGEDVTAPDTTRAGYTFTRWKNTATGQPADFPTKMPAQNMSLQAQWEPNEQEYKVETYFMLTDGSYSDTPDSTQTLQSHTDETETAALAPPDGFTGDTTKSILSGKIPATGTLTLKLYYSRNKHTLTLTDGVTQESTAKDYYYGEKLTVADPTKTGYTFKGWDLTIPATMPDSNVNRTSQWEKKSYTVTFIGNGGTFDGEPTKDITVLFGDPIKITAPKRDGYTFNGWDPEVPDAMPDDENLEYTAQWTEDKVKYTVQVYKMGLNGNYATPTSTEYEAVTGATVTYQDEGIEGFTLDENYANSHLSDTVAADGTTVLRAYYDRNKYKLIMVDGDTETYVEYFYGAAVEEPDDPSKEGHNFEGWEGDIPDTMPADDVTITATWTKKSYNLTFNAGEGAFADGSKSKTLTGEFGSAITGVEEPTKIGAEFAGWDPELPDTIPAEDKIYTALWTDGEFTLTFNAGDGKFADGESTYTVTGEYESDVAAPAAPTRTGYTFKGWLDSEGNAATIPTTMPSANQTYTANWEINKYTVTWVDGNGTVLETDMDVPYGTMPEYNGETPTKNATVQFTYTFKGWDTDLTQGITGDTIITATFDSTVNTYTIIWVDYDGTKELDKQVLDYGTTPVFSKDEPTREQTHEFSYTFAGWDPTVTTVTGDATYTAQYTETKRSYSVTFQNAAGQSIHDNDSVLFGTEYKFPKDIATPTKDADETYTYSFDGWDGNGDGEVDETLTVTGDMVFVPVFSKKYIEYTVTWIVDGKSEPEIYHYGDTPSYKNGTPTKEAGAQYTYTFTGWSPAIEPVSGDKQYTAQFDQTVNKYTVTWIVEGEKTTAEYEFGATPSYGSTPTKESSIDKVYTFDAWEPAIETVTEAATYTAKFKDAPRKYTVIFENDGGEELDKSEWEYGATPSYTGTPTKKASAQYTYTFAGWDPEVVAVTGAATYKATYTQTLNKYTIQFVNEDGTELQSSEVAYGETPSYTGTTPTKESSEEWDYTFVGWTTEIVSVSGDATYTAKYSQQKRSYTIKFVNWDNTLLENGEFILEYGTMPAYEGTPTRPEDNYNTYEFKGWIPAIAEVTSAQTYTATYTETAKLYKIAFLDADGVEIFSTSAGYDGEVTYNSKPSKAQDKQYTYTFAGWKLAEKDENGKWVAVEGAPLIEVDKVTVAGEATYVPVFTAEERSYKITWLDEDGNQIEDDDGVQTLTFGVYAPHAAQTKDNTVQYTYTFAGWDLLEEDGSYDKEIEIPDDAVSFKVEGDATYKAVFTSTVNRYTITFYDENGDVLDKQTDDYGEEITYGGEAPTKEASAETDYTFAGWDKDGDGSADIDLKDAVKIEGNAEYTAVFTESAREYKVTWDVDGEKDEVQIANGTQIDKPSDDPTKDHYIFAGWAVSGTVVEFPYEMPTKDITFTATWTPVNYTVQWDVNGDGTVEESETQKLAYNTSHTAKTGSKETDSKYSYTFIGWDADADGAVDIEPNAAFTVLGNVTYTALFENVPVIHTITIDANGGTCGVTKIEEGYGLKVTAPEISREGYTFAGWYEGANKVEFPETMQDYDMTLKAEWTAIKYTIVFDENYGSAVDDIEQGYETLITSLPETTRSGYTFDGWYDGEGNKVEASEATPLKMPLNGMTLTAKWTANTYKLIYHANDGSDQESVTQEVTFGKEAKLNMNLFTREGYTFLGWDTDASKTSPFYTSDAYIHTTVGNLDLYAIWEVKEYTITFDEDGGSEVADITADYLADIEKPADPKKEGYTFAGWYNGEDKVETFPATMPLNGMNLTARWDVNYYNVKFVDDNGTTVLKAEEELAYNATAVAPSAPKKDATAEWEYTFEGWDYNEDGVIDDLTVKAQDMTFVAVYSQLGVKYNIYWDTNGDDIPNEISTVRFGDPVVTPEPAEIEGYQFDTWGGTVPATMPANDLMFKAQYKIREYTITFVTNGGTEIATQAVPYGGSITVPADPKKENHTFDGWQIKGESGGDYDTAPATMPAENLTFTAKWLVNQATFIFYNDAVIYHRYQVQIDDTAQNILPANSPSKDGYTFLYWSDSENGTEVKFDNTLDLSVGKALYAVWEANKYKITIDENGGDAVEDISAAYESSVELPTLTRAGYTFNGWQDADGSAVTSPVTMPLNGMTVVAQWTADAKEYEIETYIMGTDGVYGEAVTETKTSATDETVSAVFADMEGFMADEDASETSGKIPAEGTLKLKLYYSRNQYTFTSDVDGKKTETTYYYGAAVADPATPTKEGHTFASWSPEVPATMPANDVEVAATWTVNNYTVTWDVDGKTTEETYAYGAEITAPADPEKEGYAFTDWDTIPDTMPAENITITAQFAKNSYTVKWMAGEDVIEEQTLEFETEVTYPEAPAKEGYKFIGWDTSVNKVPAHDVIINAVYAIQKYTIRFVTGENATTVDDITENYGTYIRKPANPTREGYTFAGWYVGEEQKTFPLYMPACDMELTAKWDINSYNVTWIVDGVRDVDTYEYGQTISAPVYTKEGYSLSWDETVPPTMPAQNLTFVAQWTVQQYAVKWIVDDETDEVNVDYGAVIELPETPTKEGYTFTGWGAEVPATMPAENLEFTAQWKINEHTVTWMIDGTEVYKEDTYKYGAQISKPADPEKEGHNFISWKPGNIEPTMPDEDLVYTAQWEKRSYSIKWTVDQSTYTHNYTYGDTITPPPVNAVTGYTFAGWAMANDATNTVIQLPETMPAENLELKAVLTANEHTVTWMVDDTAVKTEEYAYGETIKAPADPEKEGYTFNRWTDEAGTDWNASTTMPDSDVTYSAQWTVNKHTVTWNVDGAETVETYAYGETIKAPADPEKEGYTFVGWDTTLDTMPDKDVTINGLFTINQYTISFETGEGSAVEAITQNYNTYIRKPANPTREGYTFNGWLDGEEAAEIPSYMPARSYTLTADWTVNSYTITWNVDGKKTTQDVVFGTAIAKTEDGYAFTYGGETVTVENPVKEGYTFTGWSTELPASMQAKNLTLVAEWTINSHTVTWNVDGEETVDTYTYGKAIRKPATPVKEGHTFAGWGAEVPVTMPDKNLTFTAQWTKNSHTVTWIVDGVKTVQTYEYGADIVPPESPTKEGHNFKSWTPAVVDTMPDQDLTYTAEWTVLSYNLTWNVDGKSETSLYPYGTPIAKKADPDKTGYTFAGWAKSTDPETVITVPSTMPAEQLTLVAVWTVNKHTVTWNVDGQLTKETYAYGTTPAREDPEKEGYTFTGWSPAVTAMGDADVTYTATWKVKEYTITWDLNNGTEVTQSKVAYGDVITAQTPVWEGHTFTSWTVTGAEAYETAPKKMPAEDLTYTANWDASSYTVTWNVDGKLTKETYAFGAAITAPADPEKSGYVFAGWDPAVPSAMPAENMTFTARWNADKFTVTWIVDGAKTPVTYAYGATIVKLTDPVKEGYTFTGWQITSGSTSYIPNTMPAENLEITAQWKQNTYTVTWNVDGKTTVQSYLYGDTITAPADPVKEGHTFAGWKDADGNRPEATMSEGNKTYFAQWTVDSYTLTWIVDGVATPVEYSYGDAIDLYNPTKAYHTFAGWGAEVPATMPAEHLSFTAQWDPADYIITFHANNGSGETTQQTVEHNVAEKLDANPFTYEGYGFKGWATDKDSTEMPYKNGDTVRVTTDMNLYAVWEEGQYTITWNVDGEESTSSCKYGSNIVLPATPGKTGYTFLEWQDEDGNKVTASTKMPARNMILTAVWNVNYYDITWDTDGDGNVDDTTSVAYGQMPVHADGSRASVPQYDYTFTGWTPEVTAVTGNAAYKAQFTAAIRSYNVTFETNAEGNSVEAATAKYGNPVTLPTLTREGYTFKGWSTNPAASEGVSGTYTVTGETKLYAIWSANTYQISFVNAFGDTLTYRQYYGTAVEKPEDPVQEGYTFLGWENQKDKTMVVPETIPAEHLTFVAKWQINRYTITFANTGDSTMDPITADYGTAIMAPADPVREGYTFKGWDKEIPETMPAEDMTITAKWQRNVYTIRWDINGDGTVDDLEAEYTQTLEHGKMPTVQEGRKSPTDQYTYIFSGWYPEVVEATCDQVYTAQFTVTTNEYKVSWDYDGDGDVDDASMVPYGVMPSHSDVTKKSDEKYIYTFTGWYPQLTEVTCDTLYTAQYSTTGVEYTVNFLLDQNGGIFKSITAGYGTPIEAPENPTKTGYTFVDWDKAIPETMPVYGATITARWSINTYTITFDSDGGTDVNSITTRFEGPVTAPAEPTRTGYTFAGWLPAVPATMPAENMTLKAQWTPNQYTITFGSNGGSEVEAITQAYGSVVTAPAAPVREGYSFVGWDQEVPATMPAENITLTAQWTPNAYDVRFYTDDSMTELHATVTADCDAGFQLPAEPTREGYNFAGWYWLDQDGNEVAIPTIMIAGGMDVYAKWNVGTFTIQFNTAGGSVVESITAEYGAEITEPAEPEKEGYTFVGWDAAFPETMPAQSMTLNAVWEINQYTIRFNTDGGSEIASITQDYNTAVTAPAENPTKAGYTFAGWDAVIPTVMPARNVTINALWAANRYTITFNTNGGTPIDSITADFGATLTEPAAPVKTGYIFAGWDATFPATMPVDGLTLNAQWAVVEYAINWDTDGDGSVDDTTNVAYDTMPVHEDGAKPAIAEYTYVFSGWDPQISVVRGTATYTALFDIVPNEYTITFDTAGGSEIAPVTYAYGSAVAEPAAPTKEGYAFAGWDALPGTMPAKNVKVVAQWKVVDYTITFDTAGGTAVAPITAGYNTTIAAPNDPIREGYTFVGWTPAFPETMPLNGMTLTATWKINQYTIRFNSDGGTEVASITQDYGTAITAPAAPTKEGYTFQGWNAEIPATMPARDMTFTALWKYTYSGWLTDDIGTTYLKNGEKAYYAQWANIGGKDYYFDSEGYIVKGLYQTWSMDDDYEATFLFDEETGIFRKDLTTVYEWNEKLYYVENGEVINYPGLVRIVREDGEINYYYFDSDNEAVKDGTYTVTQNNDLLPVDPYVFGADGIIEHHEDTSRNGIHEENGKKYYYIDGVKVHMGLVEVDGEYYYASNGGELICGRTYWITRTNDLLPEMAYTFDEEGKIVFETEDPDEPEDPTDPTDPTDPEEPVKPVKNGIYAEDGSLFYYENDQRTYGGLMEIGGYYYYAKINGEVIHGRSFWITKTNDLMEEGSYAFDDLGRMILAEEPEEPSDPTDPSEPEDPTEPLKNGIYAEDGSLYYYEDGERTYAGLIEIDGYYYYVRTGGEVVHGRSYWITKTNGILPEKSYTFDDQGRMIDVTPDEKDTGKNGIYAEDGSLYYYENGLRTYGGLMEIDGYYYYAKTDGEVVNSRKYWITKTNGLKPETSYNFDSQGRMIIQEDPSAPLKNGIYAEDGSLYYYENGERTYAGVIILDGYYYYVKSNCEVVHSCKYWISKTNDLIPEMSYTFDDQGRIQDTRPENDDEQKNGIYKENGTLYYYVDGHKAYAGLVQIDGEYYYAKSDGAIVCGRKYWITRTNGILEEGYYTFDAEGKLVQ